MSEAWVCPECGVDYGTLHAPELAGRIDASVAEFREVLSGHDEATLRARPEADVWSALEYTAHVADVFGAFAPMFRHMKAAEPVPDHLLWDQEARAIEQAYNSQPVDTVLGDLATNANELAAVLSSVKDDEWSNTAEFSWGERDLLAMAQNGVHEAVHHLGDARTVLARVTS